MTTHYRWKGGASRRPWSLMPQRHHWIHPHRPPRRQIARRQRHHRQHPRRHAERRRITRRNPIQQSTHVPRHHPRPRQPKQQSRPRHRYALRHHHSRHISAASTERHANPNLMRPLRHRIRNNSVHSHRCQCQCHKSKKTQQRRIKSRPRQPHPQPVHPASSHQKLAARDRLPILRLALPWSGFAGRLLFSPRFRRLSPAFRHAHAEHK